MQPSVDIQCPYCGQTISLLVDESAGAQQYIEDCQVCCSPIEIAIGYDADGALQVTARSQDEA